MLEEERKFQVDDRFTMPSLDSAAPSGGRVVPLPAVTLRATYYDTADRRLARAGISLRHRRGENPQKAWTVKLPSDVPGSRHELSRPGKPTEIPTELLELVTAYHRGAPLAPAAVVRTVRRAYEVQDRQHRVLAEVADDTVSVIDGRKTTLKFREIEAERVDGGPKVLDRVEAALCKAGAKRGDFVPKHVRALGDAAAQPPDLVAPSRLPKKPVAAEVIASALRRDIGRIFAFDPFVRLGDPLPDGDTPVHQMRVGTRRLRSDLRSFGPLLDTDWADKLRAELGWLADVLGVARDAEVLRARLRSTADADPLAPLDEAAVARIDAELTVRHEEALSGLDEAMSSLRYVALLDMLIEAAREPRLASDAGSAAVSALPGLVLRPWRKLVKGDGEVPGAGRLRAEGPDAEWHAVRIRGKRARYATDAVAAVLGGGAAALAVALGRVQNLLGEHQDAAVAADTWLDIAKSDPDDHALAVTAGRLFERERAAVRQARAGFPDAWAAATKKKVTAWLS
jgi:CHAD domain-containing protein